MRTTALCCLQLLRLHPPTHPPTCRNSLMAVSWVRWSPWGLMNLARVARTSSALSRGLKNTLSADTMATTCTQCGREGVQRCLSLSLHL